ncbi:MAG TPA: Ldh family oxidoreductase [Candidatus Saccharimonadales bacterium]|nr:Ldh family oxidoreductase [Candidatus Saccharimonadales bacterium]
MKLPLTELEQAATQALLRLGYNRQEAATMQAVLLYAQVRGSSRGIAELFLSGSAKKASKTRLEIQKETPATAFIHAHSAHAMLAVSKASDIAIEKARQCGIAVIAVHHTSAASGALGYYPYKIASAGLVGIVMATTPPMVAPAGSYKRILGANPLAVAIPTAAEPLVLDMDTAVLAFPSVQSLVNAQKPLPEQAAYDKNGYPTTDPLSALQGAMRPFGGYKGSHLSVIIQLLAGPLAGSDGTADNVRGHLVLAINPEILGGTNALKAQTTTLLTRIKKTKKLPGTPEILLPGEIEEGKRQAVLTSGKVEIDKKLYKKLLDLR